MRVSVCVPGFHKFLRNRRSSSELSGACPSRGRYTEPPASYAPKYAERPLFLRTVSFFTRDNEGDVGEKHLHTV